MMPSPLGEEAARQQAREVTAAAQGGRRGGRKRAPSSASRFWGLFAPRGIPHTYRIDSPTGRYLYLIVPAGWERFFAAAGLPAAEPNFSPPDEEDFDRIGDIAAQSGVSILGPPRTES